MLLVIIPKYAAPIDDPCCYPLGLAYIVSELERYFKVEVCNKNLGHSIPDLSKYEAVLTHGFPEVADQIFEVAELAKQAGIPSILGGGMATYYSNTMIKYFSSVICGEGESCFPEAIFKSGVYYGIPKDLKTSHRPSYEAIGLKEYHQKHSWRYMGVLTSRGCPYSCTFCSNICQFRTRSMNDVSDEIDEYQRDYKIEHLVVYDNTLNISRGYFNRFVDQMKGRGLSWSACLRSDNITEADVIKAKNAGLNYALVGVESLRQEKLDSFNKKLNVQDTYNLLEWLTKHKVKFVGGVFLGTGEDTMDDVVNDIRLMKASGFNLAPNTFTAFPGTLECKSSNLTDIEHKNLEILCGDFRINNSVTFGTGFKKQHSAVVGLSC